MHILSPVTGSCTSYTRIFTAAAGKVLGRNCREEIETVVETIYSRIYLVFMLTRTSTNLDLGRGERYMKTV